MWSIILPRIITDLKPTDLHDPEERYNVNNNNKNQEKQNEKPFQCCVKPVGRVEYYTSASHFNSDTYYMCDLQHWTSACDIFLPSAHAKGSYEVTDTISLPQINTKSPTNHSYYVSEDVILYSYIFKQMLIRSTFPRL